MDGLIQETVGRSSADNFPSSSGKTLGSQPRNTSSNLVGKTRFSGGSMKIAKVKREMKKAAKIANRLINKKGYRDAAIFNAGYAAGLADGHGLKRIYK